MQKEETMDKLHVVFKETKEVHASSIASTTSSTMIKIGIASSETKDLSLFVFKGPFGVFIKHIRGMVGNYICPISINSIIKLYLLKKIKKFSMHNICVLLGGESNVLLVPLNLHVFK